MGRSIDSLMAIIWDTCKMDPYANTLKALHFNKDGFVKMSVA